MVTFQEAREKKTPNARILTFCIHKNAIKIAVGIIFIYVKKGGLFLGKLSFLFFTAGVIFSSKTDNACTWGILRS